MTSSTQKLFADQDSYSGGLLSDRIYQVAANIEEAFIKAGAVPGVSYNHSDIASMAVSLMPSITDLESIEVPLLLSTQGKKLFCESLKPEHEKLEDFWRHLHSFNLSKRYNGKEEVDHSNEFDLLAIGLEHLAHLRKEDEFEELDQKDIEEHLHLSRQYKYLGKETITSRLTGEPTLCWIFQRPEGQY
ncbi:hypothetical protein [Marinibactrum halimedae]|uniref:Uncharacterized protein n=1 Tax=Marinibactrum halimedae TaxID=1444977 RepID=A0AA37T483_9GAMM|nr:hypothetical protein [Marinibactrum halimedae]MCD9459162.1 hypothetical protein [Marinibactrum halimedae]GLS24763.1 hypothetical protein GCM10007877_04770 [Marinibactrum halimedae]